MYATPQSWFFHGKDFLQFVNRKFFYNEIWIVTWISYDSETCVLPVNVFWLSWWKYHSQVCSWIISVGSLEAAVWAERCWEPESLDCQGLLQTPATHGPSQRLQGCSGLGWCSLPPGSLRRCTQTFLLPPAVASSHNTPGTTLRMRPVSKITEPFPAKYKKLS